LTTIIAIFGIRETTRNRNVTSSPDVRVGFGYPTLKKFGWLFSIDQTTPKYVTAARVKYNNA
jgi:hypothetical protein